MAKNEKELKGNVAETEAANEAEVKANEATEAATTVEVVEESDEGAKRLQLLRTTRKGQDGRSWNDFFVEGLYRSRKIKADLLPSDTGAYEVLTSMFDDAKEDGKTVDLSVIKYEMRDAKTNKVTKGERYEAILIDNLGITRTCKLKKKEDSDLANLGVLLQLLKIEQNKPA